MWLVDNERAGNSHSLQGSGVLQRDAVYPSSRSARFDRWIVMLAYGGAALFGVIFWIVVAWLCW